MSSDIKSISATWVKDLSFIGNNSEGGQVQMGLIDEKPGLSPVELVLVGMAGCSGIDIVNILNKKKLSLTDFKINVRGTRATSPPKVYTEVEVEYLLWGEDLKEKDVEHAIDLSEKKYCSVSIMVGKTAKINSSYKILKPGESAL